MADASSETILVVDDDALSRKLLVRALTTAGYATSEAESGRAALDYIQGTSPALLLLDLDMPEMDGAEMLTQLRASKNAESAQIPAIMLTGHGGPESEVLCLEAGANDFVTKPINPAVLRARIETHLRLRSLRRQLQQQNEELEAWRENLERDLAAARLTQQSLIPHKSPGLQGWDIAASFRPVIEVGGDMYGWGRMKDGRALFWIADAAGHGASAALLTTLTTMLFNRGADDCGSPAAIMQMVNHEFRSIFGSRSFLTAMCVALDIASGKGVLVGAGHPPLLIVRNGGTTELIPSSTPPLGLAEAPHFVETPLDLASGDAFVLYTDGLFGGTSEKNSRLSPEKLAEIAHGSGGSAEAILHRLISHVAPKDDLERLADDLAAVAIRRLP